jgi:hypothetical protein
VLLLQKRLLLFLQPLLDYPVILVIHAPPIVLQDLFEEASEFPVVGFLFETKFPHIMQRIGDLLRESSIKNLWNVLFLAFGLETDAVLLLAPHVHPREAALAEEVCNNKEDRLQIISPGLFTAHVCIHTQVHVGPCNGRLFLVYNVPA